MGLFKKKSDPISERARAINEEIAALEAQIQKLSAQEAQPPAETNHLPQNPPAAPELTPAHPQPRLRSTALPHHRHQAPVPVAPPPKTHEPVFEEMDQRGIQSRFTAAPTKPPQELEVRKSDLTAFLKRLKNHFRGPPTSNPKLVNYLAAGSIQGLRPLRYERRVARNRFIAVVICLVLVLWGLFAILAKHR
jgi:hypothetical protein